MALRRFLNLRRDLDFTHFIFKPQDTSVHRTKLGSTNMQ